MKTPSAAQVINPDLVLYGYTIGVFPMADSNDGQVRWYFPLMRAIIPLEHYRPSRSLRQVISKHIFTLRINTNFEQTMRECATGRGDGCGTWISEEMISVYTELHRSGYAHSVEAYYEDTLVGGLYGVAIGAAFFGESMFYRMPNASKVCFDFLINRLRERQFELLDSQYINDNVRRFGAIEITKEEYSKRLSKALERRAVFDQEEVKNAIIETDDDEKHAIILPNTRIISNTFID